MNCFKRGALIVFEGVDRSGKSTQSKKLVESLRNEGYKSELMIFPDRTTHTGQLISEYLGNNDCKLNDQAIHLLFTANRWENVDKMKQLLNDGVNLVVDRYSYSGIVFSAAKGLDIDWCKHPEVGMPQPDLVFLLSLSNEVMQQRPNFGRERYENIKMQIHVRELYKQIADDNWYILDANRSIDDLHYVLFKSSLNVIKSLEQKPLTSLHF